LVTFASILTALVCWRGLPLAGLILVVPLTGGFLYLDTRRVSRWRAGILGLCVTRGLEAALFRKTMSQLKHLPQGSLQAMLATLPADSSNPPIQEGPLSPGRNAGKNSEPDWRIMVATAALTFALAGAVAAWHWRSLLPLLITAGSTALFVLVRTAKT
jgi:hypothetical protein